MKKLFIIIGIALLFSACDKVQCYYCAFEGYYSPDKERILCDKTRKEVKEWEDANNKYSMFKYKCKKMR